MYALLLAALSITLGQGADAEEYLAYREALRTKRIAAATAELESLRATYRAGRRRMKQVDARALMAKIKSLPKEIKALKTSAPPIPAIKLDAPLIAGQMGILGIPSGGSVCSWSMEVLQIPQTGDVLVQCYSRAWVSRMLRSSSGRVLPQMTKEPGPRREEALLWFSGVDTSRITTGAEFASDACFRVEGTKTYSTAAGTPRTVFALRQLDLGR